jgi:hypothetical protein
MTRRLITVTTLAATLAAGTLLATPASADNVAFGLSFNVPGLSVGVGTPAYGGLAYGAAAYGGAAYAAPRYGYAPYRPHYKPRYRPYAPVVYRPPVIAYPAPVVVRPRSVVYAAPYPRRFAAPYYGGY